MEECLTSYRTGRSGDLAYRMMARGLFGLIAAAECPVAEVRCGAIGNAIVQGVGQAVGGAREVANDIGKGAEKAGKDATDFFKGLR